MQLSAASYSQTISLHGKNLPIQHILDAIRKQTDFGVAGNRSVLERFTPISLNVKDMPLKEFLEIAFSGQAIDYRIDEKTIYLSDVAPTTPPRFAPVSNQAATDPVQGQQEQIAVSGRVIDRQGNAIPGVTVTVQGTTKQVATNENGEYKITVTPGQRLIFSSVGYEQREARVASSTSFPLIVALDESLSSLDETVIVAYGTSKVRDITGSISRIGKAELQNAPMGSTIQSMLQGRAPGVNVAIQSASPTSPISVVIRGASSLSGDNQPLWVIDGVPDYSNQTSGNITNSLYNLNLNDVESIDILKDASATALYGSRAANGVVIVTTKRGIAGQRPTIEVNSRLGTTHQDFNGYRYMEAPEYINFSTQAGLEGVMSRGTFDYFTRDYLDEQAFFDLKTSEFDKSDLVVREGEFYDGNTNWLKEMTQSPWVQQYDLSLRGGTDHISYFVSGFHNNTKGIIKTGGSTTYGGRLNMETGLSKGIKFGINLSGSSRDTDNKDYMLDVLKKIRPDIPVYEDDGSLFTRDPYTENPYTTLLNTRAGNGQTFLGSSFLEWQVIDGLLLRSTVNVSYANSQNLTYSRRGSTFNYDGSRSWSTSKTNTIVWENTATYARTFGSHDILALGGYSMERYGSLGYGMSASNFPDDDVLNNFPAGAVRGALAESYTANALISQFARVNYKFLERYIVSGTIRRDGSSRFGPDRRWGLFPSAAAAWLIHEEDFMKNSLGHVFSYLKLRASRGLSGSQNLGNYAWRTGIGSSRYNENPAIRPSSVGNTELQWEETLMTDVGLDYGLWNERIRGTFGVYQKKTDHLIYSQPLPPSSAFSNVSANVASLKNDGLEFDIRVDVLRNNDLTLTLDLNAARNINRVMKINNVTSELWFPSTLTPYMRVLEGERTGQWFGYQTNGRLFVTQEEVIALQGQTATGGKQYYRNSAEARGDLYFIDQNNDGVVNADDRVYLGSADPKVFGGFGASLFYKNLMVNTTFTYSYGNKRLWYMAMDDVGYAGNYNHSNLIAGKSATLLSPYEATMPRMGHYGIAANDTFSDFFLYDASFIRLNALNINYRLPGHLFREGLVQGIDFTLQATNLFTITRYPGFDPQGNWSSSAIGTGMGVDNSTYPSAKTYNVGVKLTFK